MKIEEFEPNYKATLSCPSNERCSYFSDEELSKAFEEIVTWCINNEEDKFKEAMKQNIYKTLIIHVHCRDYKSGYNLQEIVSVCGSSKIMKLIAEGRPSSRHRNTFLGNALQIAIERNDLEMVKAILIRRILNPKKYLESAYEPCRSAIFEQLIQNIFENEPQEEVDNALHECIDKEKSELIQCFTKLKQNDFYNTVSYTFPPTILPKAMEKGNYEILEIILKNSSSISMESLLNEARNKQELLKDGKESQEERKRLETVIKALSSNIMEKYSLVGPNFEAQFKRFMTKTVHVPKDKKFSTSKDKVFKELITYCIEGKADLICEKKHKIFVSNNAQDCQTRFRAMDFAAYQGHVEIVMKLFKLGAVIEVNSYKVKSKRKHKKRNSHYGETEKTKVIEGINAMEIAIARNNVDVVNCLFEHGFMPGDQIIQSIKKENLKATKYLVDNVDVNLLNKEGWNGLHYACKMGKLEYVELLLNNGANINEKSGLQFHKRGPLHFAVMSRQYDVVKFVIDHGVDVFMEDTMNFNALDLLLREIEGGKDKLINFLDSKMKCARMKHQIEESRNEPTTGKKRKIQDDSNQPQSCQSKSVETQTDIEVSMSDSRSSIEDENEPKTSKKRKIQQEKSTKQISCQTDSPLKKSEETQTESGDPIEESSSSNVENQIPTNRDENVIFVQPLKDSFLRKDISFQGKMTCLSAIDLFIARDPKACEYVAKKEVIDEIASLVSEIVSKPENVEDTDFAISAKILARMKVTNEGKKHIGEMKLSFNAFEKLNAEMKKFECNSIPEHFAFDSSLRSKIKGEL